MNATGRTSSFVKQPPAAASPCPRAAASSLSIERQPFFYITSAFVVGIITDRFFEPARLLIIAVAIASITFALISIARKKAAPSTLALLIAFMSAGAMLSSVDRSDVDQSRLKRLYERGTITANDPVELTGALALPPEPAQSAGSVAAYYLDVDTESILIRGEAMQASGRARLMITLSDETARSGFDDLRLGYGSRLRVLVRLEQARSFANPGSPDFNEFLERKGYDLKGTIKSPLLIEPLGRAPANRALAFLYSLRLQMMSAIDRTFEPRVAGTLKAMLLGNRYFLDADVSERLRESATFHTLVISGLHITLIAVVILRFPMRARRARLNRHGIARTIIALLVLWGYAVMVGLAAPVTRATVMITVGLIGPLLFRQAASINTVSLAAFILLALEPAMVADPGFQLSFIAVAAIVALALPFIKKLESIGQWKPTAETPRPPDCSRAVRLVAETLFWDERGFNKEMRRSPVRYRLQKARAARALGRFRLQWLARFIATALITSIFIQLATMPLMAAYFNRVAPVGVLLNIASGLLTAVIMLASIAAISVIAASALLSGFFVSVVSISHDFLVDAVKPFLSIAGATFRVAHYEGWQAIVYALYFVPLAMIALLIARWQPVYEKLRVMHIDAGTRRRSLPISLACAAVLVIFVVAAARPATQAASGRLAVYFLDVGQGDAALVVFPEGATMLVDAGGDISFKSNEQESEREFKSDFSVGEAVVSRFLWSQGRTRIDYALATHAHADHTGGFSDIAKNFRVGQVIVGNAPASDEFNRFAASFAARAVPLAQVAAGERFEIQGVTIEVLWPPRKQGESITSGNDDSVVLRLVYGSVSLLLTGDIEETSEAALLQSGFELRADVLKAPHHGSITSSTESLIRAANPRCVVIPVGERSRFGHPSQIVVNRYQEIGARVFQTGRDGMVTVETDGATISISTYRNNAREFYFSR